MFTFFIFAVSSKARAVLFQLTFGLFLFQIIVLFLLPLRKAEALSPSQGLKVNMQGTYY